MGQTCTTETCCGENMGKGEIRGDIGSMNQQVSPGDMNQSYRPMEITDSQRQRLLAMGNSGDTAKMTLLLARVVKIQAIFRGKLVRKRLEEIRNAVQNGTEHGEFDDNCNENELF